MQKKIWHTDLDAYKLRCRSENAGKIKKRTVTDDLDACHKPARTAYHLRVLTAEAVTSHPLIMDRTRR